MCFEKDFFKTFYKFLSDVTDTKPNLIVGFSWKSDFFIQSDDPSYHIWQQAKEQTREFTIDEFGEKEIDGIVRQLEESVGDLDGGIKQRIKESSQGLPWLTKKLCIHIFDQIQSGLAKENLIESNLNIHDLFKKDEEKLSGKEIKAIKLIAKKAYDGNFFDETEVGDVIESETIMSLLHKRLIIRSGANYNIYWDIYRNYLVTGEIPPIGESYLLRQGVNLCLEVFLQFQKSATETIDSLVAKHPKSIGAETLYNILIELRNLGIIQKKGDTYQVNKLIQLTREGFTEYITNKFQNYTPVIKLKKLGKPKISKSDIIQILKSTVKQEFQENTWITYANNLISWLLLADLQLNDKIVEPTKGRGRSTTIALLDNRERATPRSTVKELTQQLELAKLSPERIERKYTRDLLLLEVIDIKSDLTAFGKDLVEMGEMDRKKALTDKAMTLPKMQTLKAQFGNIERVPLKSIVDCLPENFFDGTKASSKLIYANKAISWLKATEEG